MAELLSHPLVWFVVLFLLLSSGAWIGAAGLRRARSPDGVSHEDFGVVQAATLTLLALLIGFSFSMAVNRYDLRKNYEAQEASTIETEGLRASLLPPADAAIITTLLAKYLAQRILFYQVRDRQQLLEIDVATTQLEAELWARVRDAAMNHPTPVIALVVSGMNEVFRSQRYTQAEWLNRIPIAAWSLILAIAMLCNVLVGYGARSDVHRSPLLFVLPLVVSLTVSLVADIDSPRGGVIRVAPQNLLLLARLQVGQ